MKEEKRELSTEEFLHLASDQHQKEVMPDVDTSKFVLNRKPKAEIVRNFGSTANITEEQRRLYNQNGAASNHDAVLADRARQALQIAKLHAEEETAKHAKASEKKTTKSSANTDKFASDIRAGNFDSILGALIEGSENLK